ncbi:MAG: hypothetical protein WD317_04680 [Balneolaceae bacterium]
MSVLFLFIDGIGVGEYGEYNPLCRPEWDSLMKLTGGQGLNSGAKPVSAKDLIFRAVDATLDVRGLPQSGTGQASLFSGGNASKLIGRHFGPFPHSRTRFLLEEESLFQKVLEKGLKPHFINGYPDIFFEKMSRRNRWTCTTLMASSAGQRLNRMKEVTEGRAITADITQEVWGTHLHSDVKEITAEEAAGRFLKVAESYDLTMFEYYLTDKAGHSMRLEESLVVLNILNRFINHIIQYKENSDHLIICSDHGNLEDLSVKTHTRNPVPLIAYGGNVSGIKKAHSIMDVTDIILGLLDEGSEAE